MSSSAFRVVSSGSTSNMTLDILGLLSLRSASVAPVDTRRTSNMLTSWQTRRQPASFSRTFVERRGSRSLISAESIRSFSGASVAEAQSGDTKESKTEMLYSEGFQLMQEAQNAPDPDEVYAKSAAKLREAVNQEHIGASVALAHLYAEGKGVEQDYGEAFNLLCNAADAGDSAALNNLATLYQNGRGVSADSMFAAELYGRAIIAGSRFAKYNLSVMLHHGTGVEKDEERAEELLFDYLDDRNDPDTQFRLAAIYLSRNQPKKARKHFEVAAEFGHVDAITNLGILALEGLGELQSSKRARELLTKAADMGGNVAQYHLGRMHLLGIGCDPAFETAVKFFQESAAQGFPLACNTLGVMLLEGNGLERDEEAAVHYFERAAKHGTFPLTSLLGRVQLYSSMHMCVWVCREY